MKARVDPVLALGEITAGQWGMFTTAQANTVEVTTQAVARLADRGYVHRLRHGVYRLSATGDEPEDDVRAVWLALDPRRRAWERLEADPGAVVSHGTASRFWSLGDLNADLTELTVGKRRQSRSPDVRFHIGELARSDWSVRHGLPVTTPLRTIRDLAHIGIDGGHLAGVVRDALVDLHVDLGKLSDTLAPYARRYGIRRNGDGEHLLRHLLDIAGAPLSTIVAARSALHDGLPVVASSRVERRALEQIPREPDIALPNAGVESPILGQLQELSVALAAQLRMTRNPQRLAVLGRQARSVAAVRREMEALAEADPYEPLRRAVAELRMHLGGQDALVNDPPDEDAKDSEVLRDIRPRRGDEV